MTRYQLTENLYALALSEYERTLFNEPPMAQNKADETFAGKIYAIARQLRLHEQKRKGVKRGTKSVRQD